jgi:hypothetical protein
MFYLNTGGRTTEALVSDSLTDLPKAPILVRRRLNENARPVG